MFSLIGLCSLLFFLYLRPQEAIPSLQSLPWLNLCAALAGLGVVIDLRLRRTQIALAPAVPWVLALGAWGVLATLLKAGTSAGIAGASRIMIPWIVMLLIAHGVTTFRGLQGVLLTVLLMGLCIAAIGVHQGLQPLQCWAVKDAYDRELVGAKSDGRPCEKPRDCFIGDPEPGADYLCEKPGILGTGSVGGGRVRFRGILQDPNEVALATSVVLPIMFGFYLRRRSLFRGALALAAVGLVGWCIVYTQSRGGQLVFLTVLGVYFVRRFGWAKGLLVGVLLGLPILMLGGRSGEEADSSAMERTEALYAGIYIFFSSPLFGVGITQFVEHHYITAHNSYLLCMAELGLPGFFMWSSMIYLSQKTMVVAMRRYGDRPEAEVASTWAMSLFTSLAGLMVGIFFLSFCYHVVLYIFLGMAAAFYQCCKRHDPEFQVRYTLYEMLAVLGTDCLIGAAIFAYARHKVGE